MTSADFVRHFLGLFPGENYNEVSVLYILMTLQSPSLLIRAFLYHETCEWKKNLRQDRCFANNFKAKNHSEVIETIERTCIIARFDNGVVYTLICDYFNWNSSKALQAECFVNFLDFTLV